MNVIVDTSVWSLVLRRHRVDEAHPAVRSFRFLVEQGHGLHLVGNILQELLDGVAAVADFHRLVTLLQPFPLAPLSRDTFIAAARLRNDCRKKGVQASPVDFLIAAACMETGFALLTTDHDFAAIADHCNLQLIES